MHLTPSMSSNMDTVSVSSLTRAEAKSLLSTKPSTVEREEEAAGLVGMAKAAPRAG